MSAAHEVLFDAPGPRARARQRITAVVVCLAALGLLALVLVKLGEKGNLTAEKWSPFLTSDPWVYYLLPGIQATLLAAGISMVTAAVFAATPPRRAALGVVRGDGSTAPHPSGGRKKGQKSFMDRLDDRWEKRQNNW